MASLSQHSVSIIDWCVVGLSGVTFAMFLAGAVYVGTYRDATARHAGASFNYLWSARVCFQLAAAGSVAAQVLRLQVLWGPESVIVDPEGKWLATAMCRVYLAVEYGLCEPVTLLLALFACVYSVQSKLSPPVITGGSAWESQPLSGGNAGGAGSGRGGSTPTSPRHVKGQIRHPNFNIVFFALGFTLPACTAQLVCALFTRIFDLDFQGVPLFRVMFASYDTRETQYCPPDTDSPSTACAWCVFPVLSTLISGGFLLAFLLAFWVVTGRIANAAISKLLIQRIRVLQLLVTCSLVGSVGCRAATVLFQPFQLGFELLRLGHVLLMTVALLSMSHLLIWRPVRDSKIADKHLEAFKKSMTASGGFGSVGYGWGDRQGGSYWQNPASARHMGAVGGAAGDGGDPNRPALSVRSPTLDSVAGSLRKGSTPPSVAGTQSALAANSTTLTVASGFSGISLAAGMAAGVEANVGAGGTFWRGPGSQSTGVVAGAGSQHQRRASEASLASLSNELVTTTPAARAAAERQPLVADMR